MSKSLKPCRGPRISIILEAAVPQNLAAHYLKYTVPQCLCMTSTGGVLYFRIIAAVDLPNYLGDES